MKPTLDGPGTSPHSDRPTLVLLAHPMLMHARLVIVARFCELMGGSVSATSKPGDGSRFLVRLPAVMVDLNADTPVAVTVA